jgi:hypothetical protein
MNESLPNAAARSRKDSDFSVLQGEYAMLGKLDGEQWANNYLE